MPSDWFIGEIDRRTAYPLSDKEVSAVARLASLPFLAVVSMIAAACGASGDLLYTADDAGRIAEVGPAATGWAWPVAPQSRSASTSVESDPGVSSDDPVLAEYQRQTTRLTEVAEEGARWRDDGKLGNLVVQVFGSAAEAEQALTALNAYSRSVGATSGTVTKAAPADGPGADAWVLWVGGNGTEVTYHWRRGNLVIETHVHCFGTCAGDIDDATRAWADAVDEVAKRADS